MKALKPIAWPSTSDEARSTPHAAGPLGNEIKQRNFNHPSTWMQSSERRRIPVWDVVTEYSYVGKFEKHGMALERVIDGSYIVVDEATGKRTKAANLQALRAIFADVDRGGSKARALTQRDVEQSPEEDRLEAWLSRQFEKAGWHLYRLGDSTLMATAPEGSGLSCQLPDLRSARAFLTMVGGAA